MFESLIQNLGLAISSHPYMYLFVGMIFAGESVLVPAIFFAIAGTLRIGIVIVVSAVATVISDAFWYYLGLHLKEKFYRKLIGEKIKAGAKKLSSAFENHGAKILFLSKFVYGTRIAAQLLSGAHRMPLPKYFIVNIAGVACLTGILIALTYLIHTSVGGFARAMRHAEITFLVLVAIVGLLHVSLGVYFKKKWFGRDR